MSDLEPPNDAPEALARAALAFRAGNLDAALSNAGRAVQLAPGAVDALIALATVQHARDDSVAAAPPLNRALRLAPANPHARHLRALILRSQGKSDEALAERRLAAAAALYHRGAACASQDYAAALEALGTAAAEAGQPDLAAGLFGRALAVQPEREAAALGLAKMRCAEGRPEDAAAILSTACQWTAARGLAPGRPALFLALGAVLADAGRRSEAASAFRTALAAAPETADIARRLARVAEGVEAEMAWRRVLALTPLDVEAHGALTTVLASTGRGAEALALARRWVVLSDADPAATEALGALSAPGRMLV